MVGFRLLAAGVFAALALTAAVAAPTTAGPIGAVPFTPPWMLRTPQFPSNHARYRGLNDASSWTNQVLYTFSGPDGSYPNAVLRVADGTLYGTTNSGGGAGCNGYGCGTVYELKPPARGQTL